MNNANPTDLTFTYEIRTDPNGWKYAVVFKNQEIYSKWDFGTVFEESDIEGLVNDLNAVARA